MVRDEGGVAVDVTEGCKDIRQFILYWQGVCGCVWVGVREGEVFATIASGREVNKGKWLKTMCVYVCMSVCECVCSFR